MKKTVSAIFLSLWLTMPALCEPTIEKLIEKMLSSDRSSWSELVNKSRASLKRTQLGDSFKQASILLKQGRTADAWALAEAIDFVDSSLEVGQPYVAYAELSLVAQLELMDKKNLVKQYLEELVQKHPDSPKAQCELGKFYLLNGQVAAAESPLRKAIELAPNWFGGYLWLGEYAIVRGDAEAAKALFRKTLQLDPKNPIAADALNGLEKPASEPFSANQQAMEHFNRAESFFDGGKYNDAIREYELALKDDPKMGKAQIYMGDAYLKLGQAEKAIDCYRKAIVIAPTDKQAYRFLGDVLETRYETKGDVADLDEAIAAYQKAVEIDPNYKMASEGLERAVRKRK